MRNTPFGTTEYDISAAGLNAATIHKYIRKQEKQDQMNDKLAAKEYGDPLLSVERNQSTMACQRHSGASRNMLLQSFSDLPLWDGHDLYSRFSTYC